MRDRRRRARRRDAPRAPRRRARAPHADRVRPAAVPRGAPGPRRDAARSCSRRCGATTCRRARAPSTRTSARSAASSAPTSCAPCTASATRSRTSARMHVKRPHRPSGRSTRCRRSSSSSASSSSPRSRSPSSCSGSACTARRVAVGQRRASPALVALVVVWFLARGMTSPLREMAAATEAMARGDFTAARHRDLARRDRRARPRVQPDGGRARRDRPRAPRPRRQRQPRAAHADHRAAGGAREPRRRRRAARPRDVRARCSPRSSGSAGSCSSSSTSPGSSRARVPLDRQRVRGRADARARGARDAAARAATSRSTVDGRAAATSRRRRRRARAPGRREPPRERGAALAADGGAVEVRAIAHRRRRRASRCSTRARASPTPTRRASSSASTAPTPPRSSSDGGAGLGLAIARWIVDLHGGDIHAEPREPHGCRMVVTFPAASSRTSRRAPSRDSATRDPSPPTKDVDDVADPHRRSAAADPARRDGARRRRRRPRERGRPHDGGRVGDARGDQLHAALGARARVHAVRRRAGSTSSTSGRWSPPGRAGCDTAFTVSIDHRDAGSGIGAADRALTIRRVPRPDGPRPSDFLRPGHVFPLRAREGGVLERRGHTEAAVDLARLAGLPPVAVICEVLHDDGSPARFPYLELFARGAPHRDDLGRADRRAPRSRIDDVERVGAPAAPLSRACSCASGVAVGCNDRAA